MRFKRQVEDAVIEGVLLPVRWSADGDVSQMGLMTFDEAEYRVDATVAAAHGLRSYLRKGIRIVGRTRGHHLVEVKAVEILESSAPAPPAQPESADRGLVS